MPNRLADEKSPYLQQHASNPVAWLAWGEEAFAKARAEQKPIFLSIGYSTCHWCHVMAHESFENEAIAEILNASFVPVKVDREERPDVDRTYMTYVQAVTGYGGWPLSVWLTPELQPFFGGTYFPPEDLGNRKGFASILQALASAWDSDRERVIAEGERVIAALKEHYENKSRAQDPDAPISLSNEALEAVLQDFSSSFDPQWGGFGGAPKFPRGSGLDFLFWCAEAKRSRNALLMPELTLVKMAQGGIHDHVGGGFHRYSVDGEWFVPHFEKMLYDQAQLALNYLNGFTVTGNPVYAGTVRDILDYVLRDLVSPEGAFYSAEDADSAEADAPGEHAEGAFYLWSNAEIRSVLEGEAEMFCSFFDVHPEGNIAPERDPKGEFSGRNHLRQSRSILEVAADEGVSPAVLSERLTAALQILRDRRAARPRPHRDEKILTAWNGLMVSAMARASRVLDDETYRRAGVRAAEFVTRELIAAESPLLFRSYCAGRSVIRGFAEDYAFWIHGLIELYQATFDVAWLRQAMSLQESMDRLFWDELSGGYFETEAGGEKALLRTKEDYDGALPASNSIAVENLLRLAPFSGAEAQFNQRARLTAAAFSEHCLRAPQAMPRMLCALGFLAQDPGQVVLVGEWESADFATLRSIAGRWGGRRLLVSARDADGWSWLFERVPWLASMPAGGEARAYVCDHSVCQAPVSKPDALRALLQSQERSAT